MRQVTVAKMLLSLGHDVRIFGSNANLSSAAKAEYCLTAKKALEGSDAVILPLPVSRDGVSLNMPVADGSDPLSLDEIVNTVAKNKSRLIIGGIIPDSLKSRAEELGITVEDYYAQEELQRKNALPSAEGALMLAMENSDTVMEGLRVLVTGYGRTGRLTAEKLRAMGAQVSVAARRDEVICDIAMSGFSPVRINDEKELKQAFTENEMIINTVPHIVFTHALLYDSENTPLYIEIASSPGGIDIPAARGIGMQLIFAPSLPGRYAPVSAGRYIFETVSDILRKGGMEL